MNRILFLIVLASLTTGCATMRMEEQEDPGHGAFHAAIHTVSMTVQTLVCAPTTIWGRANAASTVIDATQVVSPGQE